MRFLDCGGFLEGVSTHYAGLWEWCFLQVVVHWWLMCLGTFGY